MHTHTRLDDVIPRDASCIKRTAKGGPLGVLSDRPYGEVPSSPLASPRAIIQTRVARPRWSHDSHSELPPMSPHAISGRYLMSWCLGAGAESRVLAGWDTLSGSKVALKKARKSNGKAVRTVRNEMAVYLHVMKEVRVCDRPNLLSLEDIAETNEDVYLVLQRMPGDLLSLPVRKGQVCEDDTRWVFRDVVAGMLQLRAAGVAHRDIKPENIMIDCAAKHAKLADLGLSSVKLCRSTGEVELATTYVGTRMYAAPEVVSKRGPYDPFKADVYSLGVTLYCIHTRGAPHPDRPFPDFTHSSSAVSEELQDLIVELTASEPDSRLPLQSIPGHPWLRRGSMASTATAGSSASETRFSITD
eukprot:TRINITY_DN675_c0_g1_i1.p1 TRINITY_DN675_c0_g1~~TRINITY_DN675_c0_g1_i1.p1  ORF type:complete len:358 (+),score=54.29 TRINITY_DN675_c0_g1_i1:34-1107(+)